jgi:4-phosphopantoate--beta-alanine ligase
LTIPKTHPRYDSLITRETLVRAWRDGIVAPQGLIAHGRGEAWDYLFGESTSAPALVAEKAAAALLVLARRPAISVNGNVAALAAREVVDLANAVPAIVEVNLFHRTDERVRRIVRRLEAHGGRNILGRRPDARIRGLDSERARCHRDGIFRADVVLVPLEDGDRAEALVRMGKVVVSVDLNPLSRTSLAATVPIVDELTRALPNIGKFVRELHTDRSEATRIARTYRKAGNLGAVFSFLAWRLRTMKTRGRRRTSPRSRRRRDPRR